MARKKTTRISSVCASCGLLLGDGLELCPHHAWRSNDGWAVSNKIWCDYFHRDIEIPRLGERERMDIWDVALPASYYTRVEGE